MTNVPANIKSRVNAKVREGIAIAEKHYGIKIKFPSIVYTKRGGVAGTADPRIWEINLNPVLLMENVEEMINDTTPHELAHLIDYQLHPENFSGGGFQRTARGFRRGKRSIHGPTWKDIMYTLGVDPQRTHNMDTSNSSVKKPSRRVHKYVCKTCGKEMNLTDLKHGRMQRGHQHWMRGCGHHAGYDYVGDMRLLSTPTVVPATVKKAAATKRSGSKLDQCRELYKQNHKMSRQELINQFVLEAGCTPKGAATYYQKLKSGA